MHTDGKTVYMCSGSRLTTAVLAFDVVLGSN